MIVTQDTFNIAINSITEDACVIDVETSGLDIWNKDKICGIGICTSNEQTFYFPYRHKNNTSMPLLALLQNDADLNLPMETMKDLFAALKPVKSLIGHNLKFDLAALKQDGFQVYEHQKLEDTITLARLYFPDRYERLNLENVATKVLKLEEAEKWKTEFQQYLKQNKIENHFDWGDPEIVGEYCENDCKMTWQLRERLTEYVIKTEQDKVWHQETDLLKVLWEMEQTGLFFDRKYVTDKIPILEARLEKLKKEIHNIAGYEFDILSNTQLGKAMDKLGLESPGKTPTGQPKWGSAELLYFDEKITSLILEFRGIEKMLGTYFLPLTNWNEPIVHTNFVPWGAVTGRMACIVDSTPIECPRDLLKYPLGKPLKELKIGDWIYSYTWKKKLCLRKIKNIWSNGFRKTIKIYLKGNLMPDQILEITEEHLIRTLHNNWKAAGSLKVGDQIISMPRRVGDDYKCFKGKVERFGHETQFSGKNKEHRWIYSEINRIKNLSTKMIVHHKDENTLNNSIDNLELMSISEHISHHKKGKKIEKKDKIVNWNVVNAFGVLNYKDAMYYRIEKIEVGEIQEVFDIQVESEEWQEDTQCFFGSGVLLHNCRNPNLQNLTKKSIYVGDGEIEENVEVMDAVKAMLGVGSEKSVSTGKSFSGLAGFSDDDEDSDDKVSVRRIYTYPEGYKFYAIDYSQMEMRIFADYVKDKELIEQLETGGFDFHSHVAKQVWNANEDSDLWKFYRTLAKNINFGLIYGIGDSKLAAGISKTLDEAREYKAQYFSRFPKALQFMQQVQRVIQQRGFVKNRFGRCYWVDKEKAYKGVNYLVQGTSADIVKNRMVGVRNFLTENNLKSKIAAQVHDELIFYIHETEEKELIPKLKEIMEYRCIDTFLPVDVSRGNSWADKKEICVSCLEKVKECKCNE